MERTPRPDEGHRVGPTLSSFVVRVRQEGARGGIVERVRDGVKEPFGTLEDLGGVILGLLQDAGLPAPISHDLSSTTRTKRGR